MAYFDMNTGVYIRPEQKNARPVIKPVEYATKEELKEEAMLAQNARAKMTRVIGQHEEYIKDLYHRHDTMRNDLNDMMVYREAIQYLLGKEQQGAPNGGKRRRRVTIQYD